MRRFVLFLAVAAALGTVFATADAGAAGVRARAAKQRLKPFHSCRRLVGYGRHYMRREQRGRVTE